MAEEKTFQVMTFYEPREGRAPRVAAYTTWASPSWDGCKVIEVKAKDGTEAKKIAIRLRKEMEQNSSGGS